MLPHGADAAEGRGDYHGGMARTPLALVAALAAAPALAQGGIDPSSGRLPPVGAPIVTPRGGPTTTPDSPPSHGSVLEQVNGVVREVDRKANRIVVESGGTQVTLSLDRNTMVYTSHGLGTVLDVVPGAQVRAGRNADMVAYWVQIRPAAPAAKAAAPPAAEPAGAASTAPR